MRVLHVVRGLANSSGTTHIVCSLAEEQARLGHDISLFYVQKHGIPAVEPDRTLVRTVSFEETIKTRHAGVSYRFYEAITRQLGEYDVLHVHAVWNLPSYLSMRTAARTGKRYIVAPQGSIDRWAFDSGHWLRRIYATSMEKQYLNKATRLQALTPSEQEQFHEFGLTAPSVIVPNGVPDRLVNQHVNECEPDVETKGEYTILFLSRLHRKKGVDILLHAFARIRKELPSARLVIAGGDAGSGYAREVRQLASSLEIADQCRFTGEVCGEDKFSLLRSASLFVLPSYSEGLPVAVLEAMACGVPVLITPGCNLPEVALHGAGLIVEPDSSAVAAGIRSLFVDEPKLRERGAKGRELVRQQYTWPRIAATTIRLYEEMMDETTQTRVTA